MADEYTIDIPGATEIFRVVPKSLQDKELRRKRVVRMVTSNSPMPEVLQWIPSVINMLDDIEDMQSTLLVLARPLLKRLPARFIPVVGWTLLAGDLINLVTALLGTVSGGRGGKRVLKNAMQFYGKKKLIPTQRAAIFFNRVPILGAVLQGAQVAENLTGFGLRLGGIMGMLNDGFWGAIRKFQGKKVIFRGPPSSDIGEKAARVLNQITTFGDINLPVNVEDMDTIIIGHALASAVLREQPSSIKVANRFEQALQTEQPTYIPWNDTSRIVLQEAGIPVDDNIKPYLFSTTGTETIGSIISDRTAVEDKVQLQCKNNLGLTERAHHMQLIYEHSAIDVVEGLNVGEQMFQYEWRGMPKIALKMVEFNRFPNRRLNVGEWATLQSYLAGVTGSVDLEGLTSIQLAVGLGQLRIGNSEKVITDLDPNDQDRTPWFRDLSQ